jgi:GNAT superfamily N-acetyltransferase
MIEAQRRRVTAGPVPSGVLDSAASGGELVRAQRSDSMMTTDLGGHPRHPPAPGYRLETRVDAAVLTATGWHESGEAGARGTMGLTGPDAIADRIETLPAHRRRGLGSTLMGALAGAAVEQGASRGILIASDDGQHLYAKLGWKPVAAVLIVTTPGNTYP